MITTLHSLTDVCITSHFRYTAPISMSEYAWSRHKTVLYGAIIFIVAAVITTLSCLATVFLSKR